MSDYKGELWYVRLLLCSEFAKDERIRDACRDTLTEIARLRDEANQAHGQVQVEREEIARLGAELDKWPRVYWDSSEPKSIKEGYRVLSVSGKEGCNCDDSWLEVYVDNPEYDGNDFAAAVDFGLYSSSEAAKAARK